jgi:hypothetical protein
VAFDQLFGVGATPRARAERRAEDRSILDWITSDVARLKKELGAADQARLGDYLEDVREIERRIQKTSRSTAAASSASCPGRPWACPTRSRNTSS